jgi:3-hydroxy-3-methylglutaryl CoA synthase
MSEPNIKVGIENIGIYLPRFRISGKVLSEAWLRPMGKAVKAVPNHDEDSLTMAVGAVINTTGELALPGKGDEKLNQIDALYFASTSAPYKEKSCASLIAAAADLPIEVRTLDFGGSLRAGTSALISGIESISAKSLKNIIITASDMRYAEPGSELEPIIGAGAAAVQIASSESSAPLEITGYKSSTGDLTDYWRRTDDRYIHYSDLKYAMTYGATKTVVESVQQFLETTGRSAAEFHKIVLGLPDVRSIRAISKQLKLKPEQLQDNFAMQIGLTGSAHSFIMLADAAVSCPNGSEVLLANYGDGCDIICFKKTSELPASELKNGVGPILSDAAELPSYTKYLSYHNHIRESTQTLTSEPFSSTILAQREENQNIKMHGKRCGKCGTIQTLDLNVCPHCKSRENFTDQKLSKRGVINTFTQEYYYPTPEPPVTMAVIDLESGGRVLAQMTDSDPKSVEIGMNVELTFRRLHQGADFINYCWKCRPISNKSAEDGGGK